MIISKIDGGLGNQMFQFAAGAALATAHDVAHRLDVSALQKPGSRDFDLGVFDITEERFTSPAWAERQSKWARSIHKRVEWRSFTHYREPAHHFDPSFLNLPKKAILSGYFQSPLYFQGYEDRIRSAFQLRVPLSDNAQKYAAKISAAPASVALHVRRGDYLNAETHKVHNVQPLDYYIRALVVLKGIVPGAPNVVPDVFLFSDDPGVASEFSGIGNITSVTGNEKAGWEDMHLMSLCDHNIIANSSFSWWGAWLNPHPQKQVIAPRQWFQPAAMREKNCVDLYPKGWILL